MKQPNRIIGTNRVMLPSRLVVLDHILPGIYVDNTRATLTGAWVSSTWSEGYYKDNYLTTETVGSKARWTPIITESGYYSVFFCLPNGTNERPKNAQYTLKHDDGETIISFDQRNRGGQWVYVGTYSFSSEGEAYVELENVAGTHSYVNADAIRILRETSQDPESGLTLGVEQISDGTFFLQITDSFPDKKSSYWVERYSEETNSTRGFTLPEGTTEFLDTFEIEEVETTYHYKVKRVRQSEYSNEVIIQKGLTHVTSRDILVPSSGYKMNALKKEFFVLSSTGATGFSVIDSLSKEVLYENKTFSTISDPLHSTTLLKGDLSFIEEEGYYKILTNNGLYSTMFPVGDIYKEIARVSVKHLSHTRFPENATANRADTNLPIEIGAGHEDAWDYRHWTSYNDTIQPFVLVEMIENGIDVPLIEDELKYGLKYLLNIQERSANGSGVMKFGQVIAAYMLLADGGVPANTAMVENVDVAGLGGYSKVCEHVIAHYLYAFTLVKSAKYFNEKDSAFSNRLRTQAIDAYAYINQYDEVNHVKYAESRTTGDYFRAYPVLNYCYKVLASMELYRLTNETSYLTNTKTYTNKITQCQKLSFNDNASKVTGYFMKDENKNAVLRNRIHAGIPLFTLSRILSENVTFTDEEWFQWYCSMAIYVQCYVKKFTATNQYNILPYGFGIGPRKLDSEDTITYRYFQGNESFGGESDGNTKTLALHAASLFEAAYVTGDKETEELGYRHLEWLFGKNPFGTPLMAGIGETKLDKTKIFTHGNEADSFDAIGACVNGIDGDKTNDTPIWTNSWKTGETWGINRAWIQLAISSLRRLENKPTNTSQLSIESILASSENVAVNTPFTVTLTIKNNGNTGTFPFSVYAKNATNNTSASTVTINSGATTTLTLNLTSSSLNEPYVVAVMLNNDRKNAKSVVGYVE